MTELDFTVPPPDPTRPEREPRRHRRHDWGLRFIPGNGSLAVTSCRSCGAIRDDSAARRGKSAARFGKDQERRIQRVYGLRKVGEFGDAVDLLGKTTKWQSRATRGAIPAWLARVDRVTLVPGEPLWITRPFAAMASLFSDRMPVLIRPVVRNGLRTVDYIVVRGVDWELWHGWSPNDYGFLVMRGETWLDLHGKEGT